MKVWVCDDGKRSRLEVGFVRNVLESSSVLEVESCIWGYGIEGEAQLPMKRFFYRNEYGNYICYANTYKDIHGDIFEILGEGDYQILLLEKPE